MTVHTDPVENRSEIVFLYDAVDANPNGNPLSGANRPRIDPQTQQAIVTDVRLKRYLRDQLDADGHGVYIRNVQEEGEQYTREKLLEDRLKEVDPDEYDDDGELAGVVFQAFLEESTDVRYFGATMSVDLDGKYGSLPDHFTGPVQFSPGKSMHAVNENEEYDSLTSVIATQTGKEQGGFGLDDHRIQYGLIRFHGLVDEHAAEDTALTAEDVERLDTLCWRAIKNQTISRSKIGQEPRFYLRVEYATESFHLGGLDKDLELDRTDGRTKSDDELRNVRDLTLSVDSLVDRLERSTNRIERVHVTASDVLSVSHGDEVGGPEVLYEALEDRLGTDAVHVIDVYDEHVETLPN
ncbi:type I-B CRISPR-associated protein Cas7/Csh2 (plasmid) [Haloferax mediterranei ATCC 33500]|uniref:CRISPR-associated Csh2 family protein n=1 Tax=Haloferax mediterranei (strain ATCC 33500 / DSM 1411 / JCM 8866 / NBRC 14739 / NCIMB 2177 / R-4) TaxID=523841 RepID=I3RB28_HALMT|nr:type I-B CRISPR-associated protein Cas7/Csh2 [Haloferax mediterranei]AFK21438.1 CRISPR-associated Csh2 family protein [Haloferax mediterranei ATCC 33500]AHZ24493.1 CRISPR-associated protein Csh2 [Haloferax mediterranei ATCC 33500]ELZ97245.1 CRISPR-associated Csh2 family protein [Haloferax mediterranei ATCC 33500]MDX5990019.1 type I-B CRISPR-associated protein Cas7/Csh2 [Haloferax mediterranei ATCC 33500]QCQ76891.1 type I-B CRISPR-associated protein Cas7/Csh2 [Haloferax mediterranei ATCC 335